MFPQPFFVRDKSVGLPEPLNGTSIFYCFSNEEDENDKIIWVGNVIGYNTIQLLSGLILINKDEEFEIFPQENYPFSFPEKKPKNFPNPKNNDQMYFLMNENKEYNWFQLKNGKYLKINEEDILKLTFYLTLSFDSNNFIDASIMKTLSRDSRYTDKITFFEGGKKRKKICKTLKCKNTKKLLYFKNGLSQKLQRRPRNGFSMHSVTKTRMQSMKQIKREKNNKQCFHIIHKKLKRHMIVLDQLH